MARQLAGLLERGWGERLVTVALFGSVARSEAREDSDIDLLIVARDLPHGRFARQDLLEEIESALGSPPLSPLLLTPEEAARTRPLYLDLTEDAVLLFDREGFFAGVLDRLRARMAELGSVRRRQGRHRYWDLKPDMRPGEIVEL